MNVTLNQPTARGHYSCDLHEDMKSQESSEPIISHLQNLTASSQNTVPILLSGWSIVHQPKAGLNPIADAAAYLFSIIGKLKQLNSYRPLNKLQLELVQEINTFHESIKTKGYNLEYLVVCRYLLCATIDEVISNTAWGSQGQWAPYSLLAAFNQDTQHQDKFYTILERAINEPALYIDLMELLYLCLTMGYKGQYRSTEHSQYQLEQITNNLYKHIRAYRGSFSKILSPMPLKINRSHIKAVASPSKTPVIFIFIITSCIIMTIFISLSYLMDAISNEAYKSIAQHGKEVLHEASTQ